MTEKKVKKVGTLTFHIAHNYGAVLQAYALPKAVETLGYRCEIIHYCFPYIYSWGHVEKLPELCEKHGRIGGTLRFVKRFLAGEYNPDLKQNKFEHFIYQTMPLSERAYHCANEMQNMEYDAILFGSDQIWNTQLTGGVAGEFVGGFECLEQTRKIAYAASCGRSSFNEDEKTHYYPLLRSFHALGIREQGFCDSLRKDGFAARTVIDPTLLLTQEQWKHVIEKAKCRIKLPANDYLLVYVFDENPAVYHFIDALTEKYKLDVCVIAYDVNEDNKKYHVYSNCGPEEFLMLFAGASRIVTTSFHGTVFSILFEREFYCIPHPTLHERTDSLLSLLGLSHRNCCADTEADEVPDIQWDVVRNVLNIQREEALQFLKEAIE